jgi:hypothetical protein
LDLRLSCSDECGLTNSRPHRAGHHFAKRTMVRTGKGVDG